MNLMDYCKKIYTLSFITRYANQVRIINEDVAQHSFFVAAIVLHLHTKYEFNLGLALQAAVSHDIMESDIGDITNDVKYTYPAVKYAVESAERHEVDKYPEPVQEGYYIFEGSLVEGYIVKLADAIQVSQYVQNEMQLGNKSVEYILSGVHERIIRLQEELEEFVRHKKDTTREK